jgi:hypothetical protein
MWQAPLVASDVVWWPAGPGASRRSVAALTVSYNTRELTAFLLWSLRTIVSWPELEIVVVDNGSRDGSAQLLAEAERDRVSRCSPITAAAITAPGSKRNLLPGLPAGPRRVDLDPGLDVVAARPGRAVPRPPPWPGHSAALVGEPQRPVASRQALRDVLVLMDPTVAWHPQAGPFADGGDPSLGLLVSAARLGIPMAPFRSPPQARHPPRTRQPRRGPRRQGPLPSLRVGRGPPRPHFASSGADQRPRPAGIRKRQALRNNPGPQPATAHRYQ